MNPMLNIAIRAARKAGNVIAKNYERRDAIESTQKGINDYVTNVDKAAEAEIIEIIRKFYDGPSSFCRVYRNSCKKSY